MWYYVHMSLNYKKIKFFGLALLIVGLLFGSADLYAQDVQEINNIIKNRKSDIRALQQKIEAFKKQISGKQKEISNLNGELSLIQNRVAKTELEIESTQIEIAQSEQELEITALGIEDKEQSIEESKVWIGSLLRAIRRSDKQDFFAVMLSEDSLGEFIRSKQQLAEMEGRIDVSLDALQDSKIELEKRLAQQQEINERLLALQEQLEHKLNELQGEEGRKSYLIAETKSSEKKYQSLVADLKKQAASIENEVATLEKQMRERLQREGKLKNTGPFSLIWPVPSRYVTSPFHDTTYPFRHIFEHSGTDIRARQGTPLKAAAAGYVGRARDNGMGYSYIMLIHPQGFATLYGHVSSIQVKKGQYVEQGQVIGLSGGQPGTPGAGPFVTGAHLHFELRKDGVPVNAEFYLP